MSFKRSCAGGVRRSLFISVAAVSAIPAHAQQSPPPDNPNDIVITGSRLPRPLADRSEPYAEEEEKGSIELGKYADFVVRSGDILNVPAEQIRDLKVLTTVLGGKTVYGQLGQ